MTATKPANLLQIIINCSEKASNIARICRSNSQLLQLLVQEKTGDEANARFEHDFKTLADVLIQETVKHDIGTWFPEMRDAIKGEESPNFTNTMGDSIAIVIGDVQDETVKCLTSALHGNAEAAEALAAEVHSEVVYNDLQLGEIPELPSEISYTDLGIWIDPIDATAEYISGDSIFTDFPGITSTGLDCVTVLIGVYDRNTGEPVLGVISQPFHNKISENIYKSHIIWGISIGELQDSNCKSLHPDQRSSLLGIFSSSENSDILQHMLKLGYEFAFSAGAGHKALKVITGEVDLYLLSKGSTFKWDTCAPQAILRSLGGNIFNYKESLKQLLPVPLCYKSAGEDIDQSNFKCNEGGLIAVRNTSLVQGLIDELCKI